MTDTLLPLPTLVHTPMPAGTRGALVYTSSASPHRDILVRWISPDDNRLGFGKILLNWWPASEGGMDVTAHLGLATSEVLLATWPGLTGHWSHVIRPTLNGTTGLCAALTVAKVALDVANRIAGPR
ncbi:hypothetical protein [Streptomyces silvisoli]|uniref:Esterase n=1 Tax=Streptomyces silvisoli TaxID=3034235 RepID=A0ABT5ZPZ8_9ACTN|nr:hypothetical protein [Streptomyces silvisoli]MDF3291901.1 hypothetical protein [Streptomyces silvisoli]